MVLLVGYFVPTIVAEARRHHNRMAILVVNLFFGWTLLGWVICLAWSLMRPSPQQVSGSQTVKGSLPQVSKPDAVDRLERLAKLREQNVLTEEEFQSQKTGILEESKAVGNESATFVPRSLPPEIKEVPPLSDRLSDYRPALFADKTPVQAKKGNLGPSVVALVLLFAVGLLSLGWASIFLFQRFRADTATPTPAVITPPVPTPVLTDQEIRKHNDEVLATLQAKHSPSAAPIQPPQPTVTATPTELLTVAEPDTHFRVTKSTWEKGGFDSIALWHVTIKNVTNRPMGNFTYVTGYGSETGVDHGSRGGRLEKRLEPGQTKSFEINDGFISTAINRASIEITSAEFLGPPEATTHKTR